MACCQEALSCSCPFQTTSDRRLRLVLVFQALDISVWALVVFKLPRGASAQLKPTGLQQQQSEVSETSPLCQGRWKLYRWSSGSKRPRLELRGHSHWPLAAKTNDASHEKAAEAKLEAALVDLVWLKNNQAEAGSRFLLGPRVQTLVIPQFRGCLATATTTAAVAARLLLLTATAAAAAAAAATATATNYYYSTLLLLLLVLLRLLLLLRPTTTASSSASSCASSCIATAVRIILGQAMHLGLRICFARHGKKELQGSVFWH